jgi:N-sulfoglucosamine sulfohydrolase
MIRTVRDHRYRYNRNYMYWKPYDQYLGYAERNETMKALRRCQAEGTLPAAAELFMGDRKPIEELYDTKTDPHEIHNLADSTEPEHRVALARLRAAHEQWVNETHDLGFIPEAVLIDGETRLGNRMAVSASEEFERAVSGIRNMTRPGLGPARRAGACSRAINSRSPAARSWSIAMWADAALQMESLRSGCLDRVAPLLDDPAAVVRVAAADAIGKLGAIDPALRVLIAELKSENPGIRLQAAIALDELGSQAAPATAALQAVVDKKDVYPARVAEHALQRLQKE